METLINIILLILGSFMTATLTEFLFWCIGEPDGVSTIKGRILSFYGVWLSKKYNQLEKDKSKNTLNWCKAAGMCIYCFGVWIAFMTLASGFFLGWYHLTSNHHWFEIIIVIMFYPAVSLFFLHKIHDND